MGRIATRMRDTILRFYQTAKRIHEQIKKDNETFIPSIADSLRQKNDDMLLAARNAAIDEINSIGDEGKRGITAWGTLDGSNVGQDAQLYYSGIKPTAAEMRKLMDRHKDNYTMLRVLADWWTKTHTPTEGGAAHEGMDGIAMELARLVDTNRRAERIDQLAASAISTIESIYRPDPTDYVKANLMDKIVTQWGENVEI